MTRPIPLATLAAALVLAACMAPSGPGPRFDGRYRLQTIDGRPIPGSADLTVAGATLRGTGPCNEYWTTNAAPWPQVALAPVAGTRRACLTEGGEPAFLAALQQVTRAEPVKGGIEMSGPAHRLRFAVAR